MTVARRAVAPRYSAPHVPRDDASEPIMLQLSDKGADYLNRVRELGPLTAAIFNAGGARRAHFGLGA